MLGDVGDLRCHKTHSREPVLESQSTLALRTEPRTKCLDRVPNSRSVFRSGTNPQIDVAGRARIAVRNKSVNADHQILSAGLVQCEQHVAEVVVQQRDLP